jgi:hypothetical protein
MKPTADTRRSLREVYRMSKCRCFGEKLNLCIAVRAENQILQYWW